MRLKKDIDIVQFLKQIQLCEGEVNFYTQEGDCLNLKSALSKYLFMAVSIEQEMTQLGKVRCKIEGDYRLLSDFLSAE